MSTPSNPNRPPTTLPAPPAAQRTYSLATRGIHADDPINSSTDVAPALHVSTTYRYPHDPDQLRTEAETDFLARGPGGPVHGDEHIYSRATAPNSSRLELLLTSLLGAPALVYSSGLAAFHALLVHVRPRVVAIGAGYHGCHGTLELYQRVSGCKIVSLFASDAEWDAAGLGVGDLVHLETPVNPSGEAFDITHHAARAHARGALLSVDATFAPPPLLDPFAWGADYVMHSGTKYFGGHSDMLCGVLAVGRQTAADGAGQKAYWSLFSDRVHLGSTTGNMESWLGVRSLRTLELRVVRQSETATALVQWLYFALTTSTTSASVSATPIRNSVTAVTHASLQRGPENAWLRQQMPRGFGPVFSLTMRTERLARRLPSKLALFHHATSLGGVESLIEWRKMSDPTVAPTVLRVSVGIESLDDLKEDLLQGLRKLEEEE